MFICRYGSQDVFRLLGRDPAVEPLTPLEEGIFAACLLEMTSDERKPFVEMGIPVPEDS